MSIRTFHIDLYDNGTKWEAAPSLLPKVSIDGEHNAATLDFNLLMPYDFVYDDFTYFVEYDDGTGVGGRSDEIEIDERTATSGTEYHLEWDIPYEVTTLGTAYVSIEAVKREDDEPVLIIKSMPVRVVFKPGRKLPSAVRETLMKALETIYARISDIADRADRGEFDGEKGDKGDPGEAGADGQNATINGHNAVTIAGDTSVSVTDDDGTLTFSSHPSWSNVTDKPSSFQPSAHTHAWDSITDKPSTFSPSAHTHAWDSVTGKPSTFPPSAHTHSQYRKTDAELIAEFDEEITIASLEGVPVRADTMDGAVVTAAEGAKINAWLDSGKPIPAGGWGGPNELLYRGYDGTLFGNSVNIYMTIPQNGGTIVTTHVDGDFSLAIRQDIYDVEQNIFDVMNGKQTKSLTDTGGYFTTDTVEGALQELGAAKKKAVSQAAPTAITLADNTEYRLTNVVNLTLTYPQGDFEVWIRLTIAASGTVTITLPTSQYIGEAPTFANGETWEVSIKDGVVIAQKAVSPS